MNRPTRSPRSGAPRRSVAPNAGRRQQSGGRSAGQSGGQPRRKPAARPTEFTVPPSDTPTLPAVETFAELNLPAALSAELTAQGVTVPFPIQGATLPSALDGRDVLGRGRTGSGKTLAFGLALLARTAGKRAQPGHPLALVMAPTRELAQQITEALTPYARGVQLRIATVVGGLSINRQASALRGGAEVVVATPGRLRDLVERGDCTLDQVRITVLDEADQMADMGFLPQVTRLMNQVPPGGQHMLFSATLDGNIGQLVRQFLSDPVVHSVDPSAGTVTAMEHHVLHIDDADKHAVVTRVAAREGRTIMFLDTKHAVDRLTKKLLATGVRAAALHGGKSQPRRTRTLDQFKTGEVTVLVATNVAARGIHVDNLDLVVNVDPPADHKDYLHRGGRTARAGETGSVVTLVLPAQRRDMKRLMSDAGIRPQLAEVGPQDEALSRITGAQDPSGIPVVIAAPAQPAASSRPRRGAGSGSGQGGPRRTGQPHRTRRGGGGGAAASGSGERSSVQRSPQRRRAA